MRVNVRVKPTSIHRHAKAYTSLFEDGLLYSWLMIDALSSSGACQRTAPPGPLNDDVIAISCESITLDRPKSVIRGSLSSSISTFA